ncbi:hypothetical protein LCGC14_2545360, partial [marine sediment metagenome]
MSKSRIISVLALVTLGLAGCSTLPRGAALENEITKDAQLVGSGFAFYPVTRALLPAVDAWPAVNVERSHGWPAAGGGSNSQIVAPSDTLRVLIWDSSENSLLTAQTQRSAPIENLVVDESGRVFVPYVGQVQVAGMSPARARQTIENRLSTIAPGAQVQVSFEPGILNSVDLVSGVSRPGNFTLSNRNRSILSLISQGGGISSNMRNPRIKLMRGGTLYATSVDRLYDTPGMDAVLRGGDKVIVEEDERYFISLGAAGKEALIPFERDYLNALEAISMIGGVADTRADPEGILILREYPRSALAAGAKGPREQRVIFAIDMTTADGLFSAKNLQIYPEDVVLATEQTVVVSLEACPCSLLHSLYGLLHLFSERLHRRDGLASCSPIYYRGITRHPSLQPISYEIWVLRNASHKAIPEPHLQVIKLPHVSFLPENWSWPVPF